MTKGKGWLARLRGGESLPSIQSDFKNRDPQPQSEWRKDTQDLANLFGGMSNSELKDAYRQTVESARAGGNPEGYPAGGTPSRESHSIALLQSEMDKRKIKY